MSARGGWRSGWHGWRGWGCLLVLCWCAVRGGGDWSDCAHVPLCTCKWSGGKKTASCPSAGLRRPPALSPDIQVLDLHDNELRALGRDAFASVGLLNLQRLNLRAARLRNLHADTFRELRILVELDLADNELNELSPGTFRGNDRLRLLVLSGNPLVELARDQLPPLPHLRTLELAGCRLRSVHSLALRSEYLPLLDSVDLRRNLLSTLRLRALAPLPALKTLSLAGNPWVCDCRLREFRDWYLSSNLGTEEVTCVEPSSRSGTRWRDVNGTDMVCSPEVQAGVRIVRAEIGTETMFGCHVRGDPQPRVTWLFDGIKIRNGSIDGEIEDTQLIPDDEDSENRPPGDSWWVNMTIANVTMKAAGEWTCVAKSSAGEARASISVILPRLQTATARTAPGIPTLLGVVFGALAALTVMGFVATSACWHFRRRRVPPSRSFTDQEKRLLDASIVVSCDRSIAEIGSPCDFELTERSLSLGDETPRSCTFDPVHITIEGTGGGAFPPPPAEFALPAPYGNIFISVSVAGTGTVSSGRQAGGGRDEFPDLLGGVGGATLPRRARTCCAVPAYDNMGPRVTAGGSSSTWSLPGASEGTVVPISIPTTLAMGPPPPPEFVSL